MAASHRISFLGGILAVFLALAAVPLAVARQSGIDSNPAVAPAKPAPAAVPPLVPYSGVALGGDGKPLLGEVDVTFLIYNEEQGVEPLWSETQTVALDPAGRYKAQLGASTAGGLPLELFATGDARWLEVQVAGQKPEARILLISVPYALKAGDAATLGGLPASAFALATPPAGLNGAVAPAAARAISNASTPVTTGGGTVGELALFDSESDITSSEISEQFSAGGGLVTLQIPDDFGNGGYLKVNGPGDFWGSLGLNSANEATEASGVPSPSLTLRAEAYGSGSGSQNQYFSWLAEPVGNNTSNPSATLNLQFQNQSANDIETGFYFNSDGTIHFAKGQTYPGAAGTGTVTSVGSGAGLTGGPITSSGTLSIATGGVTNSMLASPSLTVQAGTGLIGGGAVALGGKSPALSVDPTKVPLLSASSNTFTGSVEAESLGSSGELAVEGDTRVDVLGSSAGNYAGIQTGDVIHGIRFGAATTGEGIASDRAGTVNQNGIDLFTDFVPRLSVTHTGNVGIGTTTPAATLDVNGTVNVEGLFTLPAMAAATVKVGEPSQALDFVASAYDSTTKSAVNQTFQWRAVPVKNGTASASASLNLLFGAGTESPAETGLSVNSKGVLTFAPGQTFPGAGGSGTITGVTAGTGLTGGGRSGAVSLSVDPNLVPLFSSFNVFPDGYTFLSSQNFSGNIQVGGQVNAPLVYAQTDQGQYAVYGANGANSGAVYGGYFQADTLPTDPQGSAVIGVNPNGGNAGLFQGTVALQPYYAASPSAGGQNSPPLALETSAYSTTASAAVNPAFQWQAESTGNNTASPSATLNLLYTANAVSATSAPTETGLKLNSKGIFTFAPGQTFPVAGTGGGTITGVTTTSPLTGGAASGSVALGLNTAALETTLNGYYPQLGAGNIFTGNQSVTGNVTASGELQGGVVNATSGFDIGGNSFAFGSPSKANAFLGFAGNTSNTGTGVDNVGVGHLALDNNSSGNSNTAVGEEALEANTSGGFNTSVGGNSMPKNSTGSQNTAVGGYAGLNNTMGSDNTALGYLAGPDSASASLSDATAIGANATVSENNALVLGRTTAGSPGKAWVNVGIGTAVPGSTLEAYVNNASGLGPTVTLTNGGVGASAASALDFNTSPPAYGASYNPTARILAASDGASSSNLVFYSNKPGAANHGLQANLTITSGGKVGIGTLSPGATLDVNGNANLAGNLSMDGSLTQVLGISALGPISTIGKISGCCLNLTGPAFALNFMGSSDEPGSPIVQGANFAPNGIGVYGQAGSLSSTGTSFNKAIGSAGVWGDGGSNASSGSSTVPYGVAGTTDDAYAGYFENNSPTGLAALSALAENSASPPFYAGNTANKSSCAIDAKGNLNCTGTKNAVVPIDGGARKVALSAIESPKNWFEDFGSAQLAGGSAVVTIDPEFAQTVNAGTDYMVIPVPNGDCKGLYVTNKTPTSFEVRELGGGTSSIRFDYRIAVLRRNYEDVRFADHTSDPDPAKLMVRRGQAANAEPQPPITPRNR